MFVRLFTYEIYPYVLASYRDVGWFIWVSLLFFFRLKTAYELHIRDWSSDLCSSDLPAPAPARCDMVQDRCETVIAPPSPRLPRQQISRRSVHPPRRLRRPCPAGHRR